jgi:ArsR family transcriptional regulator
MDGVFTLVDYLNIFKALSDENRLRILLMLKQRPLCVCEIHEVLNIALSTISAHLKLLKNAGLIEDEKDGRWVIYRLSKNTYLQKLLGNLEKELRSDLTFENDRIIVSQITREVCTSKLKQSPRKK